VQVLLDGQAQIHHVCCLRAGDQLLHIEHCRGIEHRAALGDRQDGDGIIDAERRQAGSVDGIHCDVAFRAAAVADPLAVEQHRSFILLALADDHNAIEVDSRQQGAHRVHCRTVGLELVTVANPVPASNRGCLGDTDQFQRKVAVRLVIANRQRAGER